MAVSGYTKCPLNHLKYSSLPPPPSHAPSLRPPSLTAASLLPFFILLSWFLSHRPSSSSLSTFFSIFTSLVSVFLLVLFPSMCSFTFPIFIHPFPLLPLLSLLSDSFPLPPSLPPLSPPTFPLFYLSPALSFNLSILFLLFIPASP